MTDRLLEQLGGDNGPVDPSPAFRDRLWGLVDAELHPAGTTADTGAPVYVDVPSEMPSDSRRRQAGLAWIRASRTRTVPVAAGLVALLSLGAAVVLRDGEGPDGEQTVRVVDEPSAGPGLPSLAPSLGPPAVVGAPGASAVPSSRPGTSAAPRLSPGAPAAVGPSVGAGPRPWQVLYSAQDPNGEDGFEVYTAVAGNREPPRNLVGGGGFDAHPVYSPDRRQVAWTKDETGQDVRSVWLADADGSNPRRLPLTQCPVQLQCDYHWPTFGAGSRLAFTRSTANSSCTPAERCDEIVVYDLASGQLAAVAYGHSPDWSTRRDEIVYAGTAGPAPRSACESGLCNDAEIRIVDLSHPDRLSRRIGSSVGHSPRFSPDGEWIAFERSSGGVGGAGVGAIMRRDGSQQRDLAGCQQPNWAPDGRLACVMSIDGGSDVFLLDAEDEPARRLTFTRAMETQFRLYLG